MSWPLMACGEIDCVTLCGEGRGGEGYDNCGGGPGGLIFCARGGRMRAGPVANRYNVVPNSARALTYKGGYTRTPSTH